MPVELQIIRASGFVCLDTDEILDFEAGKQALQSLANGCHLRGLAAWSTWHRRAPARSPRNLNKQP